MASAPGARRGPVKVHPVTGALMASEGKKEGMHRDGCLVLPDKYINAAKDAGLGAPGGIYSHVKTLKREGEADIPGLGAAAGGGGGGGRGGGRGGSAGRVEKYKVKGTGKSALPPRGARGGGRGGGKPRIAGFSGGKVRTVPKGPVASKTKSYSFEKRRGVVNTMGGAKDTTRGEKEAKLPPKGSRKGANVHGFVGLGSSGAGRVTTKAVMGREKDRPKGGMANSAAGDAARKAPRTKIHEAAVSGAGRVVVSKTVVGGKSVGKKEGAVRDARRAYFEKKRAELAAKKKSGTE